MRPPPARHLAAALGLMTVCAQPAEAAAGEFYGQYTQIWRASSGAFYDNAGQRSGSWDCTYGQPG